MLARVGTPTRRVRSPSPEERLKFRRQLTSAYDNQTTTRKKKRNSTTTNDEKLVTFYCNRGGGAHQIRLGLLKRHPESLLCRMATHPESKEFEGMERTRTTGAFILDRDPLVFIEVLNYYRAGLMESPVDMEWEAWIKEVLYYGFGSEDVVSIPIPPPNNQKPKGGIRLALYNFCEDPLSSIGARCWSIFSLSLIVLSIVSLVVESLYERIPVSVGALEGIDPGTAKEFLTYKGDKLNVTLNKMLCSNAITDGFEYGLNCGGFCEPCTILEIVETPITFFIIEAVCVTFFTIEYIVRMFASERRCDFFTNRMNFIDLIAILPFYLNILLSSSTGALTVLRVVRLGRIFRIFRAGSRSSGLMAIANTLSQSIEELALLLFFLIMADLLLANFVYLFEHLRPGMGMDTSPIFPDVLISMYWAIVTMTSVGYGDYTPQTDGGVVVAMTGAILGVCVIALPMVIIGQNFQENFERMYRLKAVERITKELAKEKKEQQAKGERKTSFFNFLSFRSNKNKIAPLIVPETVSPPPREVDVSERNQFKAPPMTTIEEKDSGFAANPEGPAIDEEGKVYMKGDQKVPETNVPNSSNNHTEPVATSTTLSIKSQK